MRSLIPAQTSLYQKGGQEARPAQNMALSRSAPNKESPGRKIKPTKAMDLIGLGVIMNMFRGLTLRSSGREGSCSMTGWWMQMQQSVS